MTRPLTEPGSSCDPRVRGRVVCPTCRGDLADHDAGVACAACAVVYPVVSGTPWLLPERARRLRVDPPGGGR